jgi:hypothetical protein
VYKFSDIDVWKSLQLNDALGMPETTIEVTYASTVSYPSPLTVYLWITMLVPEELRQAEQNNLLTTDNRIS